LLAEPEEPSPELEEDEPASLFDSPDDGFGFALL
jgi:hypothetical protein